MMLNAFYSMIEYIDHHDYINTGVQVGKIAYDLKCMFEGKSTLGFLQLTAPSTYNSTYIQLAGPPPNLLQISNNTSSGDDRVNAMGFVGLTQSAADDFGEGNTKNLANVDGPRAFEAFFESYLMTLGNKFIDSTSCIDYTNQTDVLFSLLKSISENI